MKSFPLKIVTISIILCILSVGAVSALNPDDASITAVWASSAYYQGDIAAVSITFQSNIDTTLEITRVSVQFDWMPQEDYYSYDLSANPVSIPSLGSHTFDLTNIQLIGASAGSHSYTLTFDGLQNDVEFIWESPSSTIHIYSGNEKMYYELMPQVATKITEAENASYVNTEAQSLLQQAKSEYAHALTLATEENWTEAVTSLQATSDYLDQAEIAEQTGGQTAGQSLLLYFVIIAIVVVVALLIIAVAVRRRRRKNTDSVVADSVAESVA